MQDQINLVTLAHYLVISEGPPSLNPRRNASLAPVLWYVERMSDQEQSQSHSHGLDLCVVSVFSGPSCSFGGARIQCEWF